MRFRERLLQWITISRFALRSAQVAERPMAHGTTNGSLWGDDILHLILTLITTSACKIKYYPLAMVNGAVSDAVIFGNR